MFERVSLSGTSLKYLICLLLVTFVAQGCGKNAIVNDGNGHPYEGLTVDEDNATPTEEEQKTTLDVREGSVVQNKFQTHYLCTNSNSLYLESLRFGIKPNKRRVIIVKTLASGSFEVDWIVGPMNYYFLRELDNATAITGLFTDRVLDDDGGRMVARYSSKLGMIFGEVFNCLSAAQLAAGVSNSGRSK